MSASPYGGISSVAYVVYRVNCAVPSAFSSTPSTRQSRPVHSNLAALAMARKVRMKQSAIDAHNNVSGDQTSPGPSNSAGGAVVIAGNKWDLEGEKQEKLAALREMFERVLRQLRGAPLVTVSARTGDRKSVV